MGAELGVVVNIISAAKSPLSFLSILLPALLTALFALFVNAHLNAKRARTDALSRVVDDIRNDIRLALVAASAYWGEKPDGKTNLESMIRMYDADIRRNYAFINRLKKSEIAVTCGEVMREFLSDLTGSDFEQHKVAPNAAHLRRLNDHGTKLRLRLAEYRDHLVRKNMPK